MILTKIVFGYVFVTSLFSFKSSASREFPRRKFEAWFITYAHHFEKSSTGICNNTLQEYKHPDPDSPDVRFGIAHHADCILANTSETIKANMASAGVVLGLMPGLLSSFGPTMEESWTLVLERPLLSLFLALGAPAFYPFRRLHHQDPLQALEQPFKDLPRIASIWWTHLLISLMQYLLAAAAAVNVVALSLQLGLKTIVTWKKAQSMLPLVWVTLPLALHICAIVRLGLVLTKKTSLQPIGRYYNLPFRLLTAETRLCVARTDYEFPSGETTFLIYILDSLLPVLGVAHLFLGTMVFSSLLFIGVDDAWPLVVRFVVSAGVIQLIRMFEIAGLQYVCRKP